MLNWISRLFMTWQQKADIKIMCESGQHEYGKWNRSAIIQERYCIHCNFCQLRIPS